MSHSKAFIRIKGASEHNLNALTVDIARNEITVITGVSGSGKSSLIFDTLLAESQRRFFYTLSHYTRQFLDLGSRPKVHSISGLSPAISLAQSETPPSQRSTVGSLSDIAELVGVLFARFGQTYCPQHGHLTTPISATQIEDLLKARFRNSLIAVCAPIVAQKKGAHVAKLVQLAENGYLSAYIDEKVVDLTPVPRLDKDQRHTIKLVIDYVSVTPQNDVRLKRSLALALEEGGGELHCAKVSDDGEFLEESWLSYSTKGSCPSCGFSWPKLDSRYFNCNSIGRCNACNGLGAAKKLASSESSYEQAAECLYCGGTGLNPKLAAITLGNSNPIRVHRMSVDELIVYFRGFRGHSLQNNPAFLRVFDEVTQLLERIADVGLGYLSPRRRLLSLSGGESSRLKLSGILSEQLRGVIYILDEPSQGLHPDEIQKLSSILKKLTATGNTVIVVDHDEHLMRHANTIVDLGPGGGKLGGQIVAKFAPNEAAKFTSQSATARFLSQKGLSRQAKASPPRSRREYFELHGARLNNLKIDRVSFLRCGLNVVTGVSGAGKSSLVMRSLYPALKARNSDPQASLASYKVDHISGAHNFERIIAIDRKPLAKSSVAMVITHLEVLSPLRLWIAKLPEAQIRGFTPRTFSLQVDGGGRCDGCKGRGQVLLSMKFLADARVRCEICHGKRYKEEVLEVRFRGKNLADILDMTIAEAHSFFSFHPQINRRLSAAVSMGIGYLKLGQSLLSLSGGENQRLKLIRQLKSATLDNIVFLDEPTRGLHGSDVKQLLTCLEQLTSAGSTIVCIEHSIDCIRNADHIVELGPQAADRGGRIIFAGPYEQLLDCSKSKIRRYCLANNNY